MAFVPLEYDSLRGRPVSGADGRLAFIWEIMRCETSERDHYEWRRPPTQLHYFKNPDGSWINEEVAQRFASGEYVDTHDDGFIVRGRQLSDEEVMARCGQVVIPEGETKESFLARHQAEWDRMHSFKGHDSVQ